MGFFQTGEEKPKSDWETTLFILAEMLHIPVYKIRQEMPLSELLGWIHYIQNKGKERPIDVTSYDPKQLEEMFNK